MAKSGSVLLVSLFLLMASCSEEKEHIAPAIHDRDSVSMMTSYGVTERWDVNTIKNPSRWTFICGIFMEQFDEKFHIEGYIQADTAWYYDQLKLWELRGRVRLRNVNGLRFSSEELFWDGVKHELYSNKYSKVITPERTLEGTYFRSDENMRHYTVSNSKGSFVKSDMDNKTKDEQPAAGNTAGKGNAAAKDTVKVEVPKRQQVKPFKKTKTQEVKNTK